MLKKIIRTDNSRSTIIIRLMVGVVFISEGIQKFLFSNELGSGRFEKIGLPYPEFLGPFVGSFEISCGVLLMLGLCSRLASIPLIFIMAVAIATTKVDSFVTQGFWETLHASRTDWAMLLGSIFLLIKGSGDFSVDKKLMNDV